MVYNILQLFFQNNLDAWLVDFFVLHRSLLGVKIFEIITIFGNWQFVLPAVVLISIALFVKKQNKYIIPFIFSIMGAEAITYLGKIIFDRPRPLLAVLREIDPSFPSGHATIAVTFYGFISYILIKLLPRKYKLPIFIITILIIILIGFSRLYLGVHYFSDVFAGYFVGLLFLAVGINLTKLLSRD